jgi:hypothetical protein
MEPTTWVHLTTNKDLIYQEKTGRAAVEAEHRERRGEAVAARRDPVTTYSTRICYMDPDVCPTPDRGHEKNLPLFFSGSYCIITIYLVSSGPPGGGYNMLLSAV